MNNATQAQSMQHLKLIDDQGLDLKESDTLNLYLPALAQSIKRKRIPSVGNFRRLIGLGVLEQFPFDIAIPALAEPFDPKDKFNIDVSDTAAIKISGRGTNFESWVLPETVAARAGYVLVPHTLTQDASDEEIFQDAARDDVDSDSAAILHLVSQQQNGPKSGDGSLLTDGSANIFYVPLKTEVDKTIRAFRRAVDVRWDGRGWDFRAYAVPRPRWWFAGYRVFLRKPLDTVPV